MKQTISVILAALILLSFSSHTTHVKAQSVTSPNRKIMVTYDGNQALNICYAGQQKICTLSGIGINKTSLASVSKAHKIKTDYRMLTGKRLTCRNEANEITLTTNDGNHVHVRAYNDGIAIRCAAKNKPSVCVNSRNRWLMKWSEGYEDFYPLNPELNDGSHVGFPALFEIDTSQQDADTDGIFMLMSEADIQKGNSGSSLYCNGNPERQKSTVFTIDHPEDTNPVSPWRVFIIGKLSDIVESTLVTDVSSPSKLDDNSWIHPGVVSWVYWAYNHGSNDYNIIKQYTDMARDLHLPYVLIDAEWDEMKDGYTMEDAVRYALSQGVKPMIWYNSSVGWINGAPGPKFRLNKSEDREKEFSYIEKLGVAGVKIDFFAGDIQSTMDYHQDLLECAARHHLLVNFHGATIPRGWQRTWPNLMSTEAVYGAEWYNNLPVLTNKAACHNATLPFTRGVIGSMDYTPCTFTDSQHPHITTDGHELALTILFESGLLHLADRPSSYLSQPQTVKDFLTELPSVWDDTRLICGYPGEYVVMARRRGDVWYIAGINGTDKDLTIRLGSSAADIKSLPKQLRRQLPATISLTPRGGFVMTYRNDTLKTIIASTHSEGYKDPSLSFHDRAKDLLSRLTLEEKSLLMMHDSKAIQRLDIPEFNWWSEALHGVGRSGTATVFPVTIGMAASFNDKLLEQVFTETSDEARAKNNIAHKQGHQRQYESLSFWTPNINIFRDPRWGRGQETYGEDPYLTSRMGQAVVRGLQGPEDTKYRKLFACAKHFAIHSGPEWNRHNFNVELLPARDLWETYLPAFKDLVQKSKVREVMCAYQRFENEPCCGNNRLLQKILREEWGFTGLVTSDCWAINDFWNPYPLGHGWVKDQPYGVAKAVLSGTDVECGSSFMDNLTEAVQEGLISESQVDTSLLRLLEGRFELGDFDDDELVEWRTIGPEVIASDKHHQTALEMAHQSIVLLKNAAIKRNGTDRKILPLSKDTRVAVFGPNAADSVMLWGNYNGYPKHTSTILDAIRDKVGEENVKYLPACGHVTRVISQSWYNKLRDDKHRVGMSATYWNNRNMEGEPVKLNNYRSPLAFDNGGATVFSQKVNLTDFSASFTGTIKADRDENLEMIINHTDKVRITVNEDTIYNAWENYSDNITEASVPFTIKKGDRYEVKVEFSQAEDKAALHFDIAKREYYSDADLLNAASEADVVIFAGGISPSLEGEEQNVYYEGFRGGDRTSIDLPRVQHEIVEMLHKAGKKVVFVNCSGSAIALVPETENADAIVQAWYGGECAGEALADILFGDYNPSGKLPVTFYRSTEDLPDFLDYRMTNRTYRYFTGDPLWAFGYGQSYTSFSIGEAKVKWEKQKGNNEKICKVTVPVTNTGDMAGAEVVQLYIRKESDPDGPLKSLRAFERVYLKPGETVKVEMQLDNDSFEFFDEVSNTMRTLPGKYTLLYGSSSADNDLNKVSVTR